MTTTTLSHTLSLHRARMQSPGYDLLSDAEQAAMHARERELARQVEELRRAEKVAS